MPNVAPEFISRLLFDPKVCTLSDQLHLALEALRIKKWVISYFYSLTLGRSYS